MLDPFVYYRVPGPGQLPDSDRNWATFLDVFGVNQMLAQLVLYPGKPNSPAWGLYEDERTGPFSDGAGRMGWTFGGERRMVMTAEGFELWDNAGLLQTFVTGTDYFAEVVGADVFPGAAVKADQTAGAITVQTVELASDPDLACGVVIQAGTATDVVQVRTCGLLTLPDWTDVVGTVTLEDPEYYLDAVGAWTPTSGAQWVASRVGPLTVRVRT